MPPMPDLTTIIIVTVKLCIVLLNLRYNPDYTEFPNHVNSIINDIFHNVANGDGDINVDHEKNKVE